MSPQELRADIANRFQYHPPKEGQPEKYSVIRSGFATIAFYLLDTCPQSRELSLALTNLEQAQFWANAAIARNE